MKFVACLLVIFVAHVHSLPQDLGQYARPSFDAYRQMSQAYGVDGYAQSIPGGQYYTQSLDATGVAIDQGFGLNGAGQPPPGK